MKGCHNQGVTNQKVSLVKFLKAVNSHPRVLTSAHFDRETLEAGQLAAWLIEHPHHLILRPD